MPDQLLSGNATVNPLLHNWNVAYLRYCDGGSFVGDAVAHDTNGALHFRGVAIREATHAALLANHGLAHASEVVISGGSAGGLAVVLHADWWCDRLGAGRCVALPDSGFFLDWESPRAKPVLPPGSIRGGYYRAYMAWAFDAFNASGGLHVDCVAAMAGRGTQNLCMFAEHTAPFVHTPMFVLQSEYDSWQRYFLIDSKSLDQDLGDNITARLLANVIAPHPQNGMFLSACGYHTGGWGWLKIGGDWQRDAFASWYAELGNPTNASRRRVWSENHTYPCPECCKSVAAKAAAAANGAKNGPQQGQRAAAGSARQLTTSDTFAVPTVQIAPGVHLPRVQLGCCPANASVSLPYFLKMQPVYAAIDTAFGYHDQAAIAAILRGAGRNRSTYWITSKIPGGLVKTGGPCTAKDPQAAALAVVQQNLEQLNVSQIDLMLLHEPCDMSSPRHSRKPLPADLLIWKGLKQALDMKLVRAIGVDRMTVPQLAPLLAVHKPAVHMASMSITLTKQQPDLAHDDAMLAFCKQHSIQYNAFGVELGCPFQETDPGHSVVAAIAGKYDVRPISRVCGRWAVQKAGAAAMSSGCDPATVEQYTRANLGLFDFTLSAAEMSALDAISPPPKRTSER